MNEIIILSINLIRKEGRREGMKNIFQRPKGIRMKAICSTFDVGNLYSRNSISSLNLFN
jgi:hypothetical protein